MADNRTMEEMLQAPTEGIALTLKFMDVPNDAIKLMLIPYSLEGAAKIWYEKEPPRSILTWGISLLKCRDGWKSLENDPRDALTIIENKSKFRYSRIKPVASKVSTTSSGSSSSTDARIDKLTDTILNLVETFNKKMTTPAMVKAVEETCVICGGAHLYYDCIATDSNISSACATTGTYNQGNTGFRPHVATNYRANQISPPGFPPVQNNQNRYSQNQNQSYNQNRGNNYQAPIQHPQVELSNEFSKYKQITKTSIRAMQNQIDNFKTELKNEIHSSMQNQINNVKNELKSDINKLRNMMASYFQKDTASTSGSGLLPNNNIANPMGDLKAITIRSGVSYDGPPIPPFSSLLKVVERVPEVTKDTVVEWVPEVTKDTVQSSIKNIQPSVTQTQVPIDEPVVAPKPKPSIPYPSRANKQKLYPISIHNFIIMSNTTNNMQTRTLKTLHNAIIEVGGKDRPPMLAPSNYVQWKSRIKRYIDTKPNHELIHYCLKNPTYKFTWADKEVPISKGIDNDIYSTVDACPNVCEMWKAIERLK
nr:hypothetical protein [Tanacetum cinerariifolium]